MEIRIELKATGRGRTAAYLAGEHLGTWSEPMCAAARLILKRGAASPSDTLIGCRDGRPAISGGVGWFAARTVIENAKTGPKFARWRPLPSEMLAGCILVASGSTNWVGALSDTRYEDTAVPDATVGREIAAV